MSAIVLIGGSSLGAWAGERVTPLPAAYGHRGHPLRVTGFVEYGRGGHHAAQEGPRLLAGIRTCFAARR
ncbi:hypothetical protein [Sphaerisporangium fuscum]|uniref:hypothetical protein n=1 Tax=Sphaerisporangium fuscum TaxID=2835868 RepID=UPI001BDD020E|nr:hypothetical protein [Sphaerisporangium fuscum]